MIALISIGFVTQAGEPARPRPARPIEEWTVPVRFEPQIDPVDRSRGLPLPRNGRLNPTARNGGILLGVGLSLLGTFGLTAGLGVLGGNPFPRVQGPPRAVL